jgi:hypothetical protein
MGKDTDMAFGMALGRAKNSLLALAWCCCEIDMNSLAEAMAIILFLILLFSRLNLMLLIFE